MLCERCGTENPENVVVCLQCYYAVGIPYNAGTKGGKKSAGKMPPWAVEMGLNEPEARQVVSQMADVLRGDVIAYWFPTRDDATETQKGLADTIGKEIQAKKVKVGVFSLQGRTALFVAGKIGDPDMVRMVCDSFNGQAALAPAPVPAGKK